MVRPFLFQASQTQEPLSELEKAMDIIIDVFHQYSRREGDRDTLTKKELKLMIEKQLANYLKVRGPRAGFSTPGVPGCPQGLDSPPSHSALLPNHPTPNIPREGKPHSPG